MVWGNNWEVCNLHGKTRESVVVGPETELSGVIVEDILESHSDWPVLERTEQRSHHDAKDGKEAAKQVGRFGGKLFDRVEEVCWNWVKPAVQSELALKTFSILQMKNIIVLQRSISFNEAF